MAIKILLLEKAQLSETQKEKMWNIYSEFYHYDYDHFKTKMEGITHFSLYLKDEKIVGFTGLKINDLHQNKVRHFLIYFGQTIVLPAHRGKSLIPSTGAKLCIRFWRQLLFSKAWFWFDALSYKAYLVAAKSVPELYPSYRKSTPTKTQDLIESIGALHYGAQFQAAQGVVRKEKNYINDLSVQVKETDLKDPDVRFYAEQNKTHTKGDGLLTFVPLNWNNVYALCVRHVNKVMQSKNKKSTSNAHSKNTRTTLANPLKAPLRTSQQ